MKDNTPTSKPEFRNHFEVVALDTETKKTQSATFSKLEVLKAFTVHCVYGQVTTYNVGEFFAGAKSEEGYCILDGYKCHAIEQVEVDGVKTQTSYVPTEYIKERRFSTVKEIKTTTWELIA
jgi:hypothetical protein